MSCCGNKNCTGCGNNPVFNCPDEIITASNVASFDDNCEPKMLISNQGILASDGNQVGFSMGSDEELPIKLRPPSSPSLSFVIGLAKDGRVMSIEGKDESQVLMWINGQWQSKSIGFAKTTFSEEELQTFQSGKLPVLSCAADGVLRLGVLPPCEDSVVYISSEGKAQCLSLEDLTSKISDLLCDVIPAYDQSSCVRSILGCSATQGLVRMEPIGNKVLVGNAEGSLPCWEYLDLNPTPETSKLVFRYKGNYETFKVPAGKSKMIIKAWGAGGSLDFGSESQSATSPRSGVGGFTTAEFPVAPNAEYAVVVGGVNSSNSSNYSAYGFGGNQSPDGHNHSGGGLSGVFIGGTPVSANDYSRAIVIAGGGGAAGRSNPSGAHAQNGGPGNHPNGGQRPNMKGADATNGQTNGGGGGGGGYRGGGHRGLAGYGGSGFTHPQATNAQILYATDNTSTVPGSGDPDYEPGVGEQRNSGMVVVIFTN